MDDNERTERIPQAADSQETDLPDLGRSEGCRIHPEKQLYAGTVLSLLPRNFSFKYLASSMGMA